MVGLQIWGRFLDAKGNKITVPAPPTDPASQWLWVLIRARAAEIGSAFDFVQAPPASLAQGGAGAGCDGYGVAQRWNLGWNQPTRYGHLEDLLAMIGALNAVGTRTFFDLVLHQICGPENGGPGISTYEGADGTMKGRGATTPGWFRGNTQPKFLNADFDGWKDMIPPFCKEDDVPSRASDTPFGREISHQNCSPAGVTLADAVDLVAWIIKRTGVKDFRIDDVKGTYAPAMAMVARVIRLSGGSAYGEYFDSTANALSWATSAPMDSQAAIEDFDWHFRLTAACNGFNAKLLFEGGTCAWQRRPDLALLFVDNPDTDTSPGMQVIFNKGIAYAITLCLPARNAVVYGKDYFPASVWPGSYGLEKIIRNICWVSRMFAFGAFETRWLDQDVFAFTRDGNGGAVGWSGGLLVAVNFNVLAPRTITVQTMWFNRELQDYSGHHGNIWTDGNGKATFTLASNAFSAGTSYVLFAPAGVSEAFPSKPVTTLQTFVGDNTLDVMQLRNGTLNVPQQLLCAAGTPISATLTLDRADVGMTGFAEVEIFGPDGSLICSATTGLGAKAVATGKTKSDGWHTFKLIGSGMPAAGAKFQLAVHYTGSAS